MHSYTHCPVCQSKKFKKVLQAKDHTVSNEKFWIVQCDTCTLRFTNPVPTQQDIEPYYQSKEYISHSDTKEGFINKIYQFVRKITLKKKRKIIQQFSGKLIGSLLDIGAGTGLFINTMGAAGWDVTGVEPNKKAREKAKKNWDLNINPIENLFYLEDEKFDVITMWHVLEHVHDLEAYLEKIFKLLKSEGKYILAVPNYTSWDASKYKEMWAAYDVPRHLYHFSPDSLRYLVEKKGFKLLKIKRMPYDSFYVSMLSEKNMNGRVIRGVWNGFCSWVVSWANKRRCSSIIYLIEK